MSRPSRSSKKHLDRFMPPYDREEALRKRDTATPRSKQLLQEEAIRLRKQGLTIPEILPRIDRRASTLEHWMKHDRPWAERFIAAKPGMKTKYRLCESDFYEFSKDVLHMPVPDHAKAWVEALSDPNIETLLILVPPFFAKSRIVSMNWAAYRLACDRTVRLCRISKTQQYSRKLLRTVQHMLVDHAAFPDMRNYRPFKPEGDDTDDTWRQDAFYVLGAGTEFHSPSMEAKGIGSQIYGDRFHEIVLDDIVDVKANTPANRETYIDIIRQDMLTRLPHSGGKMIYIGTRVGSPDVPSILEAEGFFDHVIKQRAIGEDGKSLWPSSWPMDKLRKQAKRVGPRRWALQYQQTPLDNEGATFPLALVNEARDESITVERGLQAGQGVPTLRKYAKVIGLDPALAGWAVACVMAVDLSQPHHRYIVDVWREKDLHSDLQEFIVQVVRQHRPQRLVIETNAFQQLLLQTQWVQQEVRNLGCYVQGHHTGRNKLDQDTGVSSLADLFHEHTVHIAWGSTESQTRMRPFIEELVAWEPHNRDLLQDQVMAFWFAELGVRKLLPTGKTIAIYDRGKMPRQLARQRWNLIDERSMLMDPDLQPVEEVPS